MGILLKDFQAWENLDFCVSAARHDHTTPNPRHCHDDFLELVFVHAGCATHLCAGRATAIQPGSLFLIPDRCEHQYDQPSELEIYNILFTRDFLRHFGHDLRSLPNYQYWFGLEPPAGGAALELESRYFPDVVTILDETIREENADRPGARVAVLANLLRAFLFFFRHAREVRSGPAAGSYAGRISRLLATLEERCDEAWSLERMAAAVKMSTVHFRLEFKRLTGSSPIDRLLSIRLAKAAHWLLLRDRQIAEIAQRAGFNDSNYFTRQFRRHYGLTPRAYRAAGRANRREWPTLDS